jgi:hypothetical protein
LAATWLFSCTSAAFFDLPSGIPGTLEAGKIAPQATPVNSGVRTGGKESRSIRPVQLIIDIRRASQQICWSNHFFVVPSRRAFPFFSQGNFFHDQKNKIHFFLVDFKTGF